MAHRELDVAAHDVAVAQGAPLADADAVEWPDDRVGEAVLLVGPTGEILDRQLLKPVSRSRRGTAELGAFRGGKDLRRLEDHAAGDDRDPIEPAASARGDGRIERGGADAFVLGQQVVCELMEVRDAADHGCPRDHVVAVHGQLRQQLRVLGIALDQPEARIVVMAAAHRAVLAEVVHADDLVPGLQQLCDQVSADETSRPGDEDLQGCRIGATFSYRAFGAKSAEFASWIRTFGCKRAECPSDLFRVGSARSRPRRRPPRGL